MESINHRQLVGLAVAAVVVLLMIEAWVPPPAHAVHSIGGTNIDAAAYTPPGQAGTDFLWQSGPATETLAEIQCRRLRAPQPTCGAADVAAQFPDLRQMDRTLYYVWTGCVDWSGAGAVIPWAGYNIEFFAASRTLVLHCYIGTGLLYFPNRMFGTAGVRTGTLLAIPTAAIGSGTLHIHEDDRLEHLVDDQSTEYDLATATLS